MVILGLVLVLVALLVGAALIVGTSDPDVASQVVDIQLFDTVTISLNPMTMLLAGMAAMFVLWLGLVLIKSALSRKARLRRERKAAELEARERRAREEAEAAERARLEEGERQLEARRLEEERARVAAAGTDTAAGPVDTTGPADATRPGPGRGATGETTRLPHSGAAEDTTRPVPREGGPAH